MKLFDLAEAVRLRDHKQSLETFLSGAHDWKGYYTIKFGGYETEIDFGRDETEIDFWRDEIYRILQTKLRAINNRLTILGIDVT